MLRSRLRLLGLAPVLVALAVVAPRGADVAECAPGYEPWSARELAEEYRFRTDVVAPEAAEVAEAQRLLDTPVDALGEVRSQVVCLTLKHPEPFGERMQMDEQRVSRSTGGARVPAGAHRSALEQHEALEAATTEIDGANGTWTPLGTTPLQSDGPYPGVNGLGLADLAGRVDHFAYDEENGRLFATIGTGGVWMSEDMAENWVSVGDSLPTQIVGSVEWTTGGGGTLVAVSGEPLIGGNVYTGLGAFWSDDLGATWNQAEGVPDEALGFQVAVDPINPDVVYIANSKGLFRSADAGRTFVNVELPTGECAGVTDSGRCVFANFVTDVVIQEPGGSTDVAGGVVLAAIGFRAGPRAFPDGTPQAPWNGLYRSDTGEPGTFEAVAPVGFAPQERIGRTELGLAWGPDQDHDIVYAIVQDAVLLNGGIAVIDAPDDIAGPVPANTSLNGIYFSPDLGDTWVRLGDETTISENPTTGSAMNPGVGVTASAPGIQAWYNMYIKPDPTRQVEGIPTRVVFGLEEVWANQLTQLPVATPTAWQVIGRYFSGTSCVGVGLGLPCPVNRPPIGGNTTHPDQHDAIWIPDGNGGVTLIVGNDGGVYTAHAAAGVEIDNGSWSEGSNDGFHTLMPYDAAMAKDGTVWYGLQDNGSGLITPGGEQFMALGGDGIFVDVDPEDSTTAYAETQNAGMRVTINGGASWRTMAPPMTQFRFTNVFVMDPTDANHLATAGNEVFETTLGPSVASGTWVKVFDLGTRDHPGDEGTAPTATDPGNQMTAIDIHADAAYVGYCGVCDIVNSANPFQRGIATNIGGDAPPVRESSDGWHIASAAGLPNRMVTNIAIDPDDPRTITVTLGGYSNRQWLPPGSYPDENENIGVGHVYRSTDAGETFVDVSGDLPDTPAFWVELHGDQMVVGTEIGVFVSSDSAGTRWAVLGEGLPVVPISTITTAPHDSDLLVVATFGRGVYTYRWGGPGQAPQPQPSPTTVPTPTPTPTVGPTPPPGPPMPATGGGLALAGVLALATGLTVRRLRRT